MQISSVSSGWITISCQSGWIPSGPWLNFLRDAIVNKQRVFEHRADFWTMSKFFWTSLKGPLIQRCSSSAVYTPKNIFFRPFFVFSLLLPFSMLKNAFKKYPPQNRTNVQIKGGGGQRPFEQCSKKLHFSLAMASLIDMQPLSLCGQLRWLRFGIDSTVLPSQ